TGVPGATGSTTRPSSAKATRTVPSSRVSSARRSPTTRRSRATAAGSAAARRAMSSLTYAARERHGTGSVKELHHPEPAVVDVDPGDAAVAAEAAAQLVQEGVAAGHRVGQHQLRRAAHGEGQPQPVAAVVHRDADLRGQA